MSVAVHDAGCDLGDYQDMCPDCRDTADAAKCRWCNGSGVYEDETISRACPWCHGDGEARQ